MFSILYNFKILLQEIKGGINIKRASKCLFWSNRTQDLICFLSDKESEKKSKLFFKNKFIDYRYNHYWKLKCLLFINIIKIFIVIPMLSKQNFSLK